MTERNTRIRPSQISAILPNDLDGTNSPLDGQVAKYDLATGKFTWVDNGGGTNALSDLTDVQFESGTPIDGQLLQYDSSLGKWKAITLITSYRLAFANGDLNANKLIVTHNLGQKYCLVQIYDNNDKKIEPDEITLLTTNTLEIDLSSFTSLSGTWNLVVMK